MREGFRALVSALRRRAVSLASTAGWTAAAGRSEDSPAPSAPTAPPGAISALLAELTRPPVGPDMDEVREPRTGDRLGRFLLVSELGHGGVGGGWGGGGGKFGGRGGGQGFGAARGPVWVVRRVGCE